MTGFEKRPTLEEALICGFNHTPKDELIDALRIIESVCQLHSDALEVLQQLAFFGPIRDGNLVSKSGRDQLLDVGAAAKIIVNGEEGFQACTYRGFRMLDVALSLRRINFSRYKDKAERSRRQRLPMTRAHYEALAEEAEKETNNGY